MPSTLRLDLELIFPFVVDNMHSVAQVLKRLYAMQRIAVTIVGMNIDPIFSS